ncbi:hypothetical protein B296_00051968 [Ensete ventricosum]|uniref:Uncharacterized protein n=1 Tax=Ensete ventricosum TaxID=4639 RepID=A0A426XEY8_ENSVE|nr:hypothetical protein B296_00051968 [Ensete ventricosum]
MGCRSALLAVHYDIAGPIVAKQRKNERKQSNGYSVSIYCVSAGSSGTLEHSRALRSQERLQGRRPLVPIKDAKVVATVSALAGRSMLISLVLSVVEADVAIVDGLESTIKSARDRKRWKLAVKRPKAEVRELDHHVVGTTIGGAGEDEVGGDEDEDTQEKEKKSGDHYVSSVELVDAHPPEVRLEAPQLVVRGCVRTMSY